MACRVTTLKDGDDENSPSLTAADVQFLLRLRLDSKYDREETIAKIEKIDQPNTTSPELQFPTHSDDFSNFDPPHLRGVLAETVLSKKLQSHTLGLEEIRGGHFATLAPTALVDIVTQYLPIDLN